MGHSNQRGQVLIESLFVVMSVVTLLIFFQMMIDNQRKETAHYRLSKMKKDVIHVHQNEDFETK